MKCQNKLPLTVFKKGPSSNFGFVLFLDMNIRPLSSLDGGLKAHRRNFTGDKLSISLFLFSAPYPSPPNYTVSLFLFTMQTTIFPVLCICRFVSCYFFTSRKLPAYIHLDSPPLSSQWRMSRETYVFCPQFSRKNKKPSLRDLTNCAISLTIIRVHVTAIVS